MYILNAQQLKEWDQYTIEHEPISSIELMERAASKCVEWIEQHQWQNTSFKIFCGKGNNGGDGLAIARLVTELGYPVAVYILEFGKPGTEDFQTNLQRLHDLSFTEIYFLQSKEHFPLINTSEFLIDALFGSGLNKPLEGLSAQLVEYINHSKASVISIDLPSGLFIDKTAKGSNIIEASYTLTFQCLKPALLMQENASFFGDIHILDIGLHQRFLRNQSFDKFMVDHSYCQQLFKPRRAFAHKGNYGHALLLAGSHGQMGAAILASKACIRSGVGLLTCYLPISGYEIMQSAIPEAMVVTDSNENIIAQLPDEIEKYSSVGIGPGIETTAETQNVISFICRRYKKPMVIDADGLNCLALQKNLLGQLPVGSILTPHPREFDRLFGEHDNSFDRLNTASEMTKEFQIIIVLKSHHTAVVTPSGKIFFNSSGNAGMAKGGSGDVLTGIITSFIAQNYSPEHAAVLGVFIHGLAGDFAAHTWSQEAMAASDIITFLP